MNREEEEILEVHCYVVGVANRSLFSFKDNNPSKLVQTFNTKLKKWTTGIQWCEKTLRFKFDSLNQVTLMQLEEGLYNHAKFSRFPFASIFIYDIGNENTFNGLTNLNLINQTRFCLREKQKFEVLVGLKLDPKKKQEVPTAKGQELANKEKIPFIECQSESQYQDILEMLANIIVPPKEVKDFTKDQLRVPNKPAQSELTSKQMSEILEDIANSYPKQKEFSIHHKVLQVKFVPPKQPSSVMSVESSVFPSHVANPLSPSAMLQLEQAHQNLMKKQQNDKKIEQENQSYKKLLLLISPIITKKRQHLEPYLSEDEKGVLESFQKAAKDLQSKEEKKK